MLAVVKVALPHPAGRQHVGTFPIVVKILFHRSLHHAAQRAEVVLRHAAHLAGIALSGHRHIVVAVGTQVVEHQHRVGQRQRGVAHRDQEGAARCCGAPSEHRRSVGHLAGHQVRDGVLTQRGHAADSVGQRKAAVHSAPIRVEAQGQPARRGSHIDAASAADAIHQQRAVGTMTVVDPDFVVARLGRVATRQRDAHTRRHRQDGPALKVVRIVARKAAIIAQHARRHLAGIDKHRVARRQYVDRLGTQRTCQQQQRCQHRKAETHQRQPMPRHTTR